jgi:hypothetical protein
MTGGNVMARKAVVEEVLMEVLAVAQGTGCSFEELISVCQDLTWNQIFLELDRLSREGRVQLSQAGSGTYRVRVPKPGPVIQTGSEERTDVRSEPARTREG